MRFCVEDTVSLKTNRHAVGVVDRTFGDIDSHEPRPQKDYNEDIKRHPDIPKDQFSKFLKTGVPPRDTVLVAWQSYRAELIPEDKLELRDRALYVGDVVKRDASSPMSGTVIGTKASCTLLPASAVDGEKPYFPLVEVDTLAIRGVPAEEIINVHEYQENALVIYHDWVGRIEEVFDEVTVKLSNNSVVVVEDPDDLDPDDQLVDRLSVGDWVKTKKGNLRRGRWRYGAFDPNVKPHGVVVETRATHLDVTWLTRRFGPGNSTYYDPPPDRLYMDDIESGNFYVYDASASVANSLPMAPDGETRAYHVAEIAVGDRVRFKDLSGAAVKYDGSRRLENGLAQGTLRKIARTETLGYDMNVYVVVETFTTVTVLWQDLSITDDLSRGLIPDPNVEDDDEVWPGEIVCTKERATETEDGWAFKPAKIGVVQSVKPRDRIAVVRWFESSDIRFFGEDIVPGAGLGEICDTTEDVSLYDIRSTPSLTRRRGDFVLIHAHLEKERADGWTQSIVGPDWFGEVIDLGLDGKVTVRLGAAKPVMDVRVPAHKITLVYSSDMGGNLDFMPALEGESVGSDEFDSDLDSDVGVQYTMWDLDEMGNRIDFSRENMTPGDFYERDPDWFTEDEDDDSEEDETDEEDDEDEDESMPDLEPIDGDVVDTTKTTPDEHSDAERHKIEASEENSLMDDPAESDIAPAEDTPMSDSPAGPEPFLILETPPPSDHHFRSYSVSTSSSFIRRVTKEHKILRSSLPPNIFVRTWESRLDLLRVLIIGPSDTPYEFAPFVIDFHLGDSFPANSPSAYFHSWTQGMGPVNPNLYEDGKICLSLLGTWHADERNESWSPNKSTLLQVLVSIMGLVLVKEPYYNEAGYDIHRQAPETKLNSALYTERAYFRTRAFITHALSNSVEPFNDVLKFLYRDTSPEAPRLLEKAIKASKEVVTNSETAGEDVERDGLRTISRGALVMLRRELEKLEAL